MKIYTKQGDQGKTGLLGGPKVYKSDARVQAYGQVDELNSLLGLALAQSSRSPLELPGRIARIQNELFNLGGELAIHPDSQPSSTRQMVLIGSSHILKLEEEIDHMESQLEPLKNFILPGGSARGAALHVARCVCRRAERHVVELNQSQKLRAELIQYLNRLSDYLFVAARWCNHSDGVEETIWSSSSES